MPPTSVFQQKCKPWNQPSYYGDFWIGVSKYIKIDTTIWFSEISRLWFKEKFDCILNRIQLSREFNLPIETLMPEIEHVVTEKHEFVIRDEIKNKSNRLVYRSIKNFDGRVLKPMFQSESLAQVQNFWLRPWWRKSSSQFRGMLSLNFNINHC